MKNRLILIVFFVFIFNKFAYSNVVDCNEFKKFSVNYMKCKASSAKNKAVSAGKTFIKDTKEFQDKEWSEGKNQINNTKEGVNKLKEKVLN